MNVFGKITILARPARIRIVVTCAEIDRDVRIVKTFESVTEEAEIGIEGCEASNASPAMIKKSTCSRIVSSMRLTIRIGNGFDQTISPHRRDCTQPPERGSEMKVCCVYEGY